MENENSVLGMDDNIPTGKYKNMQVWEVVEGNPRYLLEKFKSLEMKFDNETQKEIVKRISNLEEDI